MGTNKGKEEKNFEESPGHATHCPQGLLCSLLSICQISSAPVSPLPELLAWSSSISMDG